VRISFDTADELGLRRPHRLQLPFPLEAPGVAHRIFRRFWLFQRQEGRSASRRLLAPLPLTWVIEERLVANPDSFQEIGLGVLIRGFSSPGIGCSKFASSISILGNVSIPVGTRRHFLCLRDRALLMAPRMIFDRDGSWSIIEGGSRAGSTLPPPLPEYKLCA
jgi:hypothetical protein